MGERGREFVAFAIWDPYKLKVVLRKMTTLALVGLFIATSSLGCDHKARHGFCEAIEAPEPRAETDAESPSSLSSPRNFSWVVDGQLAGMAHPGTGKVAHGSYDYLAAHEVTLMISLTESAPKAEGLEERGISQVHLPVIDFTAPSLDQLDHFVTATSSELTQGGRVVVHCGAGQGRTGTFLAAWFVALGATSDEAIDHVRSLRPGSIETPAQLEIVRAYAETLH